MTVNCPKCETELGVEVVTKLEEETQVHFKLSPKPGSLMSAKTIGGKLVSLAGLMKASGEVHGCKTDTLVRGVSVVDGEITFDLMVLNSSTPSAEAAKAFMEEVRDLRKLAAKCGEQFRFYQANHEAKGANDKAQTNREFAEMCEAAATGQEP